MIMLMFVVPWFRDTFTSCYRSGDCLNKSKMNSSMKCVYHACYMHHVTYDLL